MTFDRQFFTDALRRSYATVADEVEVPLEILEGALPTDLVGVLFRNGPGRLERGGVRYGHWFDGDGMISRFDFQGSQILYRNRFVATRELVAEEHAGRILYRGFGTARPGGILANALRMRFKNAANTNVIWHGGRLLALWEGGLPHALDVDDLRTHGRFNFGGRLLNHISRLDKWLTPELPFSAHPRICAETGELFNFGTLLGAKSRLVLYHAQADGMLDPPVLLPLDALYFMHDFVLTKNHRVFYLNPVRFDVPRALLGLRTPVASLRERQTEATQILVLPRHAVAPARFFSAPPGFVFHLVNGYEDGNQIIVDAMHMASYPRTFAGDDAWTAVDREYPMPYLTRDVLDLDSGSVTREQRYSFGAELPRFDSRLVGKKYRYLWAIAACASNEQFFTNIAKFDLERSEHLLRDLSPGQPGEPVFVPRGEAEDDGYVLTVSYRGDTHTSDLWILDARTLATVCRARLPHHLPPGFHGTWVAKGHMFGA